MLRSGSAGVEYICDPLIRHPRAEKVCHAANEDGEWLLPLGRFVQPIAVHCRRKSKWVRGVVASVLVVNLSVEVVEPAVVLRAPLAFASTLVVGRVACASKAGCNASRVAVFALMQAAGDWVPGAIAPLYLCFFHCLSSSYGLGRLQPQLTPPSHSVRK